MAFSPTLLSSHIVTIILLFFMIICCVCVYSELPPPAKIGKGYHLISLEETPDGGIIGHLVVNKKNKIYGPDIPNLQLYVKHETDDRLRVRITDAEKQRWEVPYDMLPRSKPPPLKQAIGQSRKIPLSSSHNVSPGSELIYSFKSNPFSFSVVRRSNGETLFNSTSEESDPFSSLVFKDQYLEISSKLPKDASLYGLGENTQPNGIKIVPNEPYTLYTSDVSAIKLNTDLYGFHPVYMDLRNVKGQGIAHAVLLLNSNGMDVFYRGDSITYKVIGGVLDFYFFAGPTPLDVVDQYTQMIGRPAPMPYWSFGFHQCRWGYRNLSVVEDVVENYKKSKIPLDVIWNDDDHMDGHKDFTLNPVAYPRPKLLEFVNKLHAEGMKYIVLIDPGISVNSSYGVYQRGMSNDVFVKYGGEPYLAQVWPGPVYFPDYFNPKTVNWWIDEIKRFHELVPIDGLWIDMNEASNFCSGLCTIPKGKQCPSGSGPGYICCLDCKNITSTKWDDPPYKINASGSKVSLGFQTIATSATHYKGILEYDAHSMYGFSETIATHKALSQLEGKRPFILSRSTYVGSGHYAAHWTGDNKGTWEDLRFSISTILNFGIFGIPMAGADICGFYPTDETPLEELCNRWIEVGAFYPFSRDHANFYSPRQELYQWESVAKSARNALGMRYKLLPFLYTLSYEAHRSGAPIARPVFFSFPHVAEVYDLSTQFLLGSSLMVSPVLERGKTTVRALFPPGSWYNLFNMTQAVVSSHTHHVTLDAPLNVVNVHLYESTILPMQQGGVLSRESRKTPFSLVVTFPMGATDGKAMGKLFVDNDELQNMELGNGQSTFVEYYSTVKNGMVLVWCNVNEGKFADDKGLTIEKVFVLGLEGIVGNFSANVEGILVQDISCVEINYIGLNYAQELGKEEGDKRKGMVVEIKRLELPIGKNFSLSWKLSF